MRAFLILVFVLTATPGLACTFDAECPLSERCIKSEREHEGRCANLNSGLRDPLDVTEPQKELCSSDIDCGLGGTCLAVGGLFGTCVGM